MTTQWTYGWYGSDSRLVRGEAPVGSYADAVKAVREKVGYTDPKARTTVARPGKALVWADEIVVGVIEARRVEMAEAV